MRGPIIAFGLLLTVALPQASAHQTVTATSSTGNVDTWGLSSTGLDVIECALDGLVQVNTYQQAGQIVIDPGALVPEACFIQTCPADFYTFRVRLELLDPSPGDAVALTVVGDLPGLGSVQVGPGGIDGISLSANDPPLYPTEVATYNDPVAEIPVQLGGCNRATTVVVTGLVVDGEVSYALTY